jgi:hypothetical protein
MGVSLKTEQRRSHTTVSSFRPWVRRAEGYRGTRHLQFCRQVPVKPRCPLFAESFPHTLRFLFLGRPPWPEPSISKSHATTKRSSLLTYQVILISRLISSVINQLLQITSRRSSFIYRGWIFSFRAKDSILYKYKHIFVCAVWHTSSNRMMINHEP